MSIIKALKLGHNYLRYKDEDSEPESVRAIGDIDLTIEKGEFIAILGHNGSGKSTLARHMNALLMPTSGTIWIDGKNPAEEKDLWKIRKKAGMVFQNPDNQIIASVVEEDVGFGPENIGIPTADIWTRVSGALGAVGMTAYRESSPNRLSGGQKQRVAIAGIVAMHPECLILDEPTAMLDPSGRREVLETLKELNRKEKVTIILITHYMEEVTEADRLYVMDQGSVILSGTPREVFANEELLKAHRLTVPDVTELGFRLKKSGLPLPDAVLTDREFLEEMEKVRESFRRGDFALPEAASEKNSAGSAFSGENASSGSSGEAERSSADKAAAPILDLQHVTYTYSVGTTYEKNALEDISLQIGSGEFIGVIGHTGSGKSTLLQHLNGLIRPTSGRILFDGRDISEKDFPIRTLRTSVGLVFQYPEHQLFETDILTDAAYGPKNQGLTKEAAEARAKKALLSVGISEDMFRESPFEISGGQKRRVAIAGILAMEPRVLILDEPTAGLDPAGRHDILGSVRKLQKEQGITVLLVTHSMEDVAFYADRLLVLHEGHLIYDDVPRRVFAHEEELRRMGLALPEASSLSHALKEQSWPIAGDEITIEEAERDILSVFSGKEDRAHD